MAPGVMLVAFFGVAMGVLWSLGLSTRPASTALIYIVSLIGPIVGQIWTSSASSDKEPFPLVIAKSTAGAVYFGIVIVLGEYVLAIPGRTPLTGLWWGLFMFLYQFILLLGYYIVTEQAAYLKQNIDSSVAHEFSLAQTSTGAVLRERLRERVAMLHVWEPLHYLSLLVSPFIVAALYYSGLLNGAVLLYWQFVIAAFLIAVFILITCVLVGAQLSRSIVPEGSDLSVDGIKTVYRLDYECRMLYFVDLLHSLIIAAMYYVAVASVLWNPFTKSAWVSFWLPSAVCAIALCVVFVFLPFYLGQQSSARKCALALNEHRENATDSKSLDELQKQLLRIAPLVPSSSALGYLAVTLTAGGVASTVLAKACEVLTK